MDDAQRARARQALLDAIAAAGSESALARILGVTQGAVNQRRRSKDRPYLTAEQAVIVERKLGIARATSRPDLFEGVVLATPDDGCIPVYAGNALSLATGDVTRLQAEIVNMGRVIHQAPRPPHILAARGVYGVRIATTAMSPRFDPGHLVLAERHAPPATGDDVLVHDATLGTEIRMVLGTLETQDVETFTLHQCATGATAQVRRDGIVAIHRIMTVDDLVQRVSAETEVA